jgi:hypothetical protein
MLIVINLSDAFAIPCQRCGWQDGLGGVELQDDSGTRKIFCRHCTLELVQKLLPDGRVEIPAPLPVALAS